MDVKEVLKKQHVAEVKELLGKLNCALDYLHKAKMKMKEVDSLTNPGVDVPLAFLQSSISGLAYLIQQETNRMEVQYGEGILKELR